MKTMMEDGREVEFSPKKQVLFNTVADGNGLRIDMAFSDGQYRTFTIPSTEALHGYALYGLRTYVKSLLGASGCSLDFDRSVEALTAGPWAAKRRAPRGSGPKASPLERALAIAFDKPIEAARSFVASKTREERFALGKDVRIAALLAQFKAEDEAAAQARKAAKTGSAAPDLLAGFALPTIVGVHEGVLNDAENVQ